ncbi:MAG: isochorismatase family protein [Chloroflexales bacterium]
MASIRAGNKAVLLVVDVQVGVVEDAWEAPRVITNICSAVDNARRLGVPVIWVQHAMRIPRGRSSWRTGAALKPQRSSKS